MKIIIHIDGGARGNPGPAGAGVVLLTENGPLLEAGYWLGRMTNNMAEYNALIRSLQEAEKRGATELEIQSDSELMVRQLNGEYRVKNASLKDLFDDAYGRLRGFEKWTIRHVRRENNARADELANVAMDAGEDVIEVDRDAPARRRSTRPPKSSTNRTTAIIVHCVRAPSQGVCPAPCALATEYVFESTTPPGLCLGPAATVLDAVRRVRGGEKASPIDCPVADCGARFEI
jgi:ribonuclease HI